MWSRKENKKAKMDKEINKNAEQHSLFFSSAKQRTNPYGGILITIHFSPSQYLPWKRGQLSMQTQ